MRDAKLDKNDAVRPRRFGRRRRVSTCREPGRTSLDLQDALDPEPLDQADLQVKVTICDLLVVTPQNWAGCFLVDIYMSRLYALMHEDYDSAF
jgi:hypothetical protein